MQDEIIQLGGIISGFTTWNVTTMDEFINERIVECQGQHFQQENDHWQCPVCAQFKHIQKFINTITKQFTITRSLLTDHIKFHDEILDEKNKRIDELEKFKDEAIADTKKIQEWLLDYQSNLNEQAYYELTSIVGDPHDR